MLATGFNTNNEMKNKILRTLGIIMPKETACYRNNIAVTEWRINWFNPLTYPYLLYCFFYLLIMLGIYGENAVDNL
jgi:hypothetical protein